MRQRESVPAHLPATAAHVKRRNTQCRPVPTVLLLQDGLRKLSCHTVKATNKRDNAQLSQTDLSSAQLVRQTIADWETRTLHQQSRRPESRNRTGSVFTHSHTAHSKKHFVHRTHNEVTGPRSLRSIRQNQTKRKLGKRKLGAHRDAADKGHPRRSLDSERESR